MEYGTSAQVCGLSHGIFLSRYRGGYMLRHRSKIHIFKLKNNSSQRHSASRIWYVE